MEVCRGLSRWMLKSPSITKGVPSSGKVESNKSNLFQKVNNYDKQLQNLFLEGR